MSNTHTFSCTASVEVTEREITEFLEKQKDLKEETGGCEVDPDGEEAEGIASQLLASEKLPNVDMKNDVNSYGWEPTQ